MFKQINPCTKMSFQTRLIKQRKVEKNYLNISFPSWILPIRNLQFNALCFRPQMSLSSLSGMHGDDDEEEEEEEDSGAINTNYYSFPHKKITGKLAAFSFDIESCPHTAHTLHYGITAGDNNAHSACKLAFNLNNNDVWSKANALTPR